MIQCYQLKQQGSEELTALLNRVLASLSWQKLWGRAVILMQYSVQGPNQVSGRTESA